MNKRSLKWIDKNIKKVELQNKTILITGANSGIGFEVSKYCAYLKMNILMVVRNIDKGIKAKQEILTEFPDANIHIMNVDLSQLSSIDYFVNEIAIHKVYIDFVYHNAGVYNIKNKKTQEGFELMLGTNFLGTYYLNEKLCNYFNKQSHKIHIIFTTSVAAYRTKIDYNCYFLNQSTRPIKYYANSKLMLIHYYKHLLNNKNPNLVFHLVHPGITFTPLFSKGYSKAFTKLINIFMSIFFHKPHKAALCTIKTLNEKNSSYNVPRGLFNVSGYPKKKRLTKKVIKGYDITIEKTKKLLK